MNNMKKTSIIVLIAGLLIISSAATIGLGKNAVTSNQRTFNLQFSELGATQKVTEQDTYEILNVAGANAQFYHAGQPALPMYTTTLTLPFGTEIVSVDFQIQDYKTMVLSNKILPAPQPILVGMGDTSIQYILDETIYGSEQLFPDTWCRYYTGGGLDSNSHHVTYVTIQVYPTRYSPATDTIQYIENGVLTLKYREPQGSPFPASAASDLVIIAPAAFTSELQKLADAKVSHGITTALKTTEDIYDEFSGVDKPEQIKYFIKSVVDNGTKYILLVGGMDSLISGVSKDDVNQGTQDWLVPVRYTNLRESGTVYDPGFISDLYYADVYTSNGSFSSWDSNHDGVFAKWGGVGGKDIIDLFPDVAVGRLACRNKIEVKAVVNKIIAYEKVKADSSWFNKMILIAGDSHNDSGTAIFEGEYTCDYIFSHFMSSFTPVKIYASNKDTNPAMVPTAKNIVREISKGAGYMLFDGHGSPSGWNTHYPNYGPWVGGINVIHCLFLHNGGKLPVTVVGGCHNSMFNNTIVGTLNDKDNSHHTWVYGRPVPEDFDWILARSIRGGTIATMGNTGLGYGAVGNGGDIDGDGSDDPDTIEALGGYQERMFFKTVNEGVPILGDVWIGTLTKYLTTFPGMADQIDCKTVEQWPILGDPSLMIGGYP